jgi:predicted metalloprotease with PDZ domain
MTAYPIRRGFQLAICAVLLTICCSAADISYTVSLASPEQHLVQVQIILPPGAADRELQMPVWNALYQVRDFAQFVNWVRAKNRAGKPLAVQHMNDSCWRIAGANDGAIVEYEMYVDSFGPFGAQFNSHHAFFNLAQILMYAVDARSAPVTVRFNHLPADWHIATPLSSQGGTYSAENYDRLVDSPFEISAFQEADFDDGGGHYRVIIDADTADYDAPTIVSNLQKIVAAATSWMNDRPFDTYTFFYHFPRGPAGGGMEHTYSTAIEINAETIRRTFSPLNSVTAHEFFHLWNVKRIRPQALEPIDYTKENFTRALWFSEGVTNTAEDIIQLRGGLMDEKRFLARLGAQISELENRPAHFTQSAEESSLGAWLEGFDYYRRPERSISYYNKGELLGWMLDLAIRDSSQGKASLRELFHWMNANNAKQGRFFDDSNGVREAAEAVSHADLGWFFTKYVTGTAEIPWNDFLRYVGLRVEQVSITVPDPGFVASRNFDGPMTVIALTAGGEADRAGLSVGDIVIEVQGKPANEELNQELSRMNPGDSIIVKVRSHGSERELSWKVAGRQQISYGIRDLDHITPQQRTRRSAWLKGEAEAVASSGTRAQ